MDAPTWSLALVVATALHAGFQLTVTLIVYPALAAVPAPQWEQAHASHSRRIGPLVAVVYGAVLVTGVGAAVTASSVATWLALAGTLAAVLVTAASAAPTHSRLGAGKDDVLVRRLLRADQGRSAAAVAALAAAVAALL